MPTIFSHAIAASAAGQWFRRSDPRSGIPDPARFWFWTIVCAMLPDIDVVGFSFGVPYESMLGHRGLTHSFLFAALAGVIAAYQIPDSKSQNPNPNFRLHLFCWFAAVTASHGILDACTDGGRGIAFFAPFSGDRYYLPWRPIAVSPIGVGFFSPRGLRVLVSESRWIWLPSAIIAASARVFRRPT